MLQSCRLLKDKALKVLYSHINYKPRISAWHVACWKPLSCVAACLMWCSERLRKVYRAAVAHPQTSPDLPLQSGRERGLGKTQSDAGGCKLLDGDIGFMLGAAALCLVDFHKISSNQTVNAIQAGHVFIMCFVPGGSSCHRHPGGASAGTCHGYLTWSSTMGSTALPGHWQPAGSRPPCPKCCPSAHRPRHPLRWLLPAVLLPPQQCRHPCWRLRADVKSRGCQQGGWRGATALLCSDILCVVALVIAEQERQREDGGAEMAPPTPRPLSPFLAQTLCV